MCEGGLSTDALRAMGPRSLQLFEEFITQARSIMSDQGSQQPRPNSGYLFQASHALCQGVFGKAGRDIWIGVARDGTLRTLSLIWNNPSQRPADFER